MKRNWWLILIGTIVALSFLFGNKARAEEFPLNLELRPGWVREHDAAWHVNLPFENRRASVVVNPCASIGYTFWTDARHPHGNKNGKLNENNLGIGAKCFLGGKDPVFIHGDALTNSKRGSTTGGGIGKEFELIHLWRIRGYVGASISVITYEVPEARELFVAILPLRHRGVGFDLPWNLGTISREEQILPGEIKLRSWGWQLKKEFWGP